MCNKHRSEEALRSLKQAPVALSPVRGGYLETVFPSRSLQKCTFVLRVAVGAKLSEWGVRTSLTLVSLF